MDITSNKMKELLIHVTSWINLYKVILSEESQHPKVT